MDLSLSSSQAKRLIFSWPAILYHETAERLAYWIGCSPFTHEVEGSTPTGATNPNDFSDSIDQNIRTQEKVVSEWRSVIAVSLNIGGGVRLIKPAKLYTQRNNWSNWLLLSHFVFKQQDKTTKY